MSMRSNDILGIVFANVHDENLSELTDVRSIASVPFGARYRIIDFALSNLVNAGISRVALMTKSNYRSLMDHLGNGKPWDLDRKTNGLFVMPPYIAPNTGYSTRHIDALYGILDFIEESPMKYVVLCDGDLVGNINLSAVFKQHIANNADVTFCYKHGPLPDCRDMMNFKLNGERIEEILLESEPGAIRDYCLNIYIMEKELLIKFVKDAYARGSVSLARDVFQRHINDYKFYGYEVCSYTAVMDKASSYVKANQDMLDVDIRDNLLNGEHPIYTKTHDSMPTRYGPDSVVSNCLIADGCKIEGCVKNSILFRNVHVKKGAVLENCIIMQNTVIEPGAKLNHVTSDKNVTVTGGTTLCGTADVNLFIKKGEKV